VHNSEKFFSVETKERNESEKREENTEFSAPLTEPYFFDGFEFNSLLYNPKDDDLYLNRLKPGEIQVEDRRRF